MASGGGVLRHRLRVAEALALFLVARGLRLWVPMRRWSRLLGPNGPAVVAIATAPLDGLEAQVAQAVLAATRRLPANCLEQAVTASLMLRVRGRAGAVVIGLNASAPDDVPHAWMVGPSGHVVTGGGLDGHRPVNQFGRQDST